MIFPVNADIIGLIQGCVKSLQPFASAQDVSLSFESEITEKEAFYQPEEIISAVTKLICRIITFTPQNYSVDIVLRKSEQTAKLIIVQISNTGVNLAIMGEINRGIIYPVKSISKKAGSIFLIQIPLNINKFNSPPVCESGTDHTMIKPWYSEIKKRLTSYFSNPQHIENAVTQRSERDGIFLKKVNAIIYHHLDQECFDTKDLAKKVALSRTQLFRRIKELTQMAPGQYIRFVRLQKAKEMLEKSDLNVSEVAYKVGFVSNSHFSRAFSRQFGINPSALK